GIFLFWVLQNGMPGLNHNGAKCRALRIVYSLVVHCDAEVPGGAEGLDPGIQLLQRAPHGFLALVEAKENLRVRRAFPAGQPAVLPVARKALPTGALMPPLISEVQNAPAFEPVTRLDFIHE